MEALALINGIIFFPIYITLIEQKRDLKFFILFLASFLFEKVQYPTINFVLMATECASELVMLNHFFVAA